MKQYLLNTFQYNYRANCKVLEAIYQLPDKEAAVSLFSHLITSQDKWMNRITKAVPDNTLHWSEPVFALEELAKRWYDSVQQWLTLLEGSNEQQLETDVTFNRMSDGRLLAVSIKDLALQLNYHSIHHRAQINKLISAQGVPVPATDYIFTVLRKV
jgi:uncharacterized damage-inducible protein DinB